MEHDKEQVTNELKKLIKDHAPELMVASREILSNVVNDELFDTLDGRVQSVMLSVALMDYVTDLEANSLSEGYLKHVLEDKEPAYATAVYIYCNWRVWAVHSTDEKLARKYQAICDKIDDYVFEHWDKKNVSFFVEQTD